MTSLDDPFEVLLYARASVLARTAKPTVLAASVDDQFPYLRAWAAREGWTVVDEFRDDGVSASRFNRGVERKGWKKVIDALESGAARGVLLYDFSRASRDMAVTNALEATCRATGAKIGYAGSLKDLSTVEGSFQVGLDGLMAARLSAEISDKVQNAVDRRVLSGEPHGDVAFGYMIVRDHRGRTVERVEDPDTGPIVRDMVSRLLAGENAHSLAKELNERGVRQKRGTKGWTGGGLEAMLRNPTYAGLRTHCGEIVPDVVGTWPALIELDDHLRVVARNQDPSRDKFRNTKKTKHLGTGIYRCGRGGCGGPMRLVSRGKDKPASYGCRECAGVTRAQRPTDEWVADIVVERLRRADFMDDLMSPADGAAQRQAVSDIARLDAEMVEARRMLENPKEGERLTLADFAAFRAGWERRKKQAEDAARPSGLPDAVASMAGPDARAAWDAADVKDKRTVVQWLVEVTILPVGHGARVFDTDSVRVSWRDHTRE